MLFNSFEFLLFFCIVFILYWFFFKKNLKLQNILILVASYYFYAAWDWRFLSLLILSTVVDYSLGLRIAGSTNAQKRKWLLYGSVAINIGILMCFKYFNFFISSWVDMWSVLGVTMHISTLNIILPVGISFYTFQTLSYTIDIYRGKMEPTRDIIAFGAFVSFFPQLVAGPIERARNLLPQFSKTRVFDIKTGASAIRQILWGMFKKVVIADNCAIYVDEIFSNYGELGGATLVLGAVYFAFQIYCDFSGYSDIAIGTAKLLGFDLMVNFRVPYFSRNIGEFWRRWHISLSTWFRDYVYIPLGGSRGSKWSNLRNVLVIFVVSGFWHGANWTFIIWGLLNAIYFIPLLLLEQNRKFTDEIETSRGLPSLRDFGFIVFTFLQTLLAWIFFRSETVKEAFDYIGQLVSRIMQLEVGYITMLYLLIPFILMEWNARLKPNFLEISNPILRRLAYLALMLLILDSFFTTDTRQFIYFRF